MPWTYTPPQPGLMWADCPRVGVVLGCRAGCTCCSPSPWCWVCCGARCPAWQAASQIGSAAADCLLVLCTHPATFCYAQCARHSAFLALLCRLDRKIQTQFPANVLSGFDDTMGSTYFNLNELQVGW